MLHTLSSLNHEWEQLKNCFQRLEWMAESRGIAPEELLEDQGIYRMVESNCSRLDDVKTIGRLRSLVFKSYTS